MKAFMAEVVAGNTPRQERLSRLVREFIKIPRNEGVCCEATRLDMESDSFLRETPFHQYKMSKLS